MMTLLINSNKKISILSTESKLLVYIIFAVYKFHYVKETHMMLVAFWRTLVKIVVASQLKRQRNKSLPRFVDNLKKHRLGLESARAALCK